MSRICAVYFSPAGETGKVCAESAGYLASELEKCCGSSVKIEYDDFTLPKDRSVVRCYNKDDLVVFGVPTYAGRVPNKILPFIPELFRGSGTPAVPVVTFGNRDFDSSLAELRDTLAACGFVPVAGAAVSCRHAFAEIGTGRPDDRDIAILRKFASDAAEMLCDASFVPGEAKLHLDGHDDVKPYYVPMKADGAPAKFLKAKPVTDASLCDGCGICSEVCPMGSVSADEPAIVDGICIKCQACVLKCPKKAKYFDDPDFLSHREYLERHCTRRAETETFIACHEREN